MRGGQFRPGPGVDGPPPATGFRRFWFIFTNHFGKLIAANLLFALFSIPLVTLPAALCGLNAVCAQLIRTGKCFLVQDFLDGFRRGFIQKTIFGMPFCIVVAGTVLMYAAEMRTAGFYAAAAVSCYFFLAACHFFTNIADTDRGEKKTTPLKLFLRALSSCLARRSTLFLLPALLLAILFTVLYISLLPVFALIGMSLIVMLAMSAIYN